MFADHITIDNWILNEPLTVAEMVDEILVTFETLDPLRKHMFIKWLGSHSHKVKNTENLCEGLTIWFESMKQENRQWEYHLMLAEIGWWSKLNDQALTKIMLADLARRGA